MKSSRVLDVVLILVIVGCGFYIGSRFWNEKSTAVNVEATQQATGPLVSAPAVNPNDVDPAIAAIGSWGVPYGVGGQLLMAKTKAFDDSSWGQFVARDPLKGLRRQETDTCAMRAMPKSHGLSIVLPELLKKIENGTAQFHIAPFTSYCSRLGDKFEVLKFSEVADEPYVQHIGTVQVLDILQGKMSQFPNSFYDEMGIARDELVTALRGRSNLEDLPISVFRYGKFQAVKTPASQPIPTYFRYPVLESGDLEKWAARVKGNYRVVDVRSADEVKAAPIPNAIHAPFGAANTSAASGKFSWAVKVSELDRSKFDVASLQTEVRDVPLLVVGSSKQDGRPLWALRELLRAGLNITWYYEGASSFIAESDSPRSE